MKIRKLRSIHVLQELRIQEGIHRYNILIGMGRLYDKCIYSLNYLVRKSDIHPVKLRR